MLVVDRRRLLQGAALAGAGLALPGLTRASGDPLARKFLFIFVRGGWDPAWALAPVGGSVVYTDGAAQAESVGGISFVDHPDHRAVGEFFTSWGDQACLLHGIEVRSVTHEACRRIMFTGGRDAVADDWPARIAGAGGGWDLPDLVLSGPAYSAEYSNAVVRVGPDGQLQKLLSASALDESDLTVSAPSDISQDAVARFLADRTDAMVRAAVGPQTQRFASNLQIAIEQRELVRSLDEELDLTVDSTGYVSVARRLRPAVQAFARGLSRCAVGAHDGQWDVSWDTHSGIESQSDHYQVLFEDLDELLGELSTTTGPAGGSLLEETTVVVFSEMGRAPRLNATGGKDHWTYTSALLLGAGVRGDQVIGAYDDNFFGRMVELESGEVSDSGLTLSSGHLGATLIALAGLDPDELAGGLSPIKAAISD